MKFAWLKNNSYHILDPSASYFGIHERTSLTPTAATALQDDPRMLVLHNNTLLVTFASVHEVITRLYYFMLDLNPETNMAEFGPIIELRHEASGKIQKNWVPVEYERRLFFIQSINPMHVIELLGHKNGNAILNTTYMGPKAELPWKAMYGTSPRGGTPAVLVDGVYLTFFHTKVACQPPFKYSTYFMGAMTLCPKHPFHIRSTSTHPIYNTTMYEGKWLWGSLDYAVYPSGLIVDEDKKHVWITVGYQDIDAYVLKIDIRKLFRSMTRVHACS